MHTIHYKLQHEKKIWSSSFILTSMVWQCLKISNKIVLKWFVNTILLLLHWIHPFIRNVNTGFLFIFHGKVLSFNHLQMEVCLAYIWFIFRLIYMLGSNRNAFKSKSCRLNGESTDHTVFTNYIYVCMWMCFALNCVSFCVNAQKWNLLMAFICLFVW